MKTIEQLASLEKLAHETGLRNEELQAEFARREATPAKAPKYGKKFVDYLGWLYDELSGSYNSPNRSPSLPVRVLPPFDKWAENILDEPVKAYLK